MKSAACFTYNAACLQLSIVKIAKKQLIGSKFYLLLLLLYSLYLTGSWSFIFLLASAADDKCSMSQLSFNPLNNNLKGSFSGRCK